MLEEEGSLAALSVAVGVAAAAAAVVAAAVVAAVVVMAVSVFCTGGTVKAVRPPSTPLFSKVFAKRGPPSTPRFSEDSAKRSGVFLAGGTSATSRK